MTLKLRTCCDEMKYNITNEYVRVEGIRVGIFLNGFHINIYYCPWCGQRIILDRDWEGHE